jgi:ABC-2 type transport system permease protein
LTRSPFAAIGILFGHLMTPGPSGPPIGGTIAFFALQRGLVSVAGVAIHKVAEAPPSHWRIKADHIEL